MKKLVSLILILILVTAYIPCHAAEPGEAVSSFEVGVIKHYLGLNNTTMDQSHRPLEFDITIPETMANGTLFVAFYTDGIMTKLVPMDISSSTTLATIELYLNYSEGDGGYKTPTEVKIFTWATGGLKPLTKGSGNVLTGEVMTDANVYIVRYILEPILGENGKSNLVSYMKGLTDDSHDKILSLLDAMTTCAADAYAKKETHLLTSEFGRRLYYDEINTVIQALRSDATQMQALQNMYSSLSGQSDSRGKDSYNLINRLFNFLCIDKDQFLN